MKKILKKVSLSRFSLIKECYWESKRNFIKEEVLRQYIIDWNYYTEEEKELLTTTFTKEELHYMDQSRKEIDQVIKKTKTKSYKR